MLTTGYVLHYFFHGFAALRSCVALTHFSFVCLFSFLTPAFKMFTVASPFRTLFHFFVSHSKLRTPQSKQPLILHTQAILFHIIRCKCTRRKMMETPRGTQFCSIVVLLLHRCAYTHTHIHFRPNVSSTRSNRTLIEYQKYLQN